MFPTEIDDILDEERVAAVNELFCISLTIYEHLSLLLSLMSAGLPMRSVSDSNLALKSRDLEYSLSAECKSKDDDNVQ